MKKIMHHTFDSEEERAVGKNTIERSWTKDISEHSRLMDKEFVSISEHFWGVTSFNYASEYVKQCRKDIL